MALICKFRQSGVPTRDLSSRRILNVRDLSRVKAESRIPSQISVEYRVEYRILADFLNIKVKFLLVYMGHSRIII